MSRRYGDPIEVWTREGEPGEFVWRDRLHVVCRVLGHWVIAKEGWKTSPADPGERRFWRVEATRDGETGAYELRFDTSSGAWLLMRAWEGD